MPIRRSLSFVLVALLSGAGGAVLVAEESQAQEARAAYAYVTANLNQRAGPGTQFPPIVVIPARSQVLINGCLPNLCLVRGHLWRDARLDERAVSPALRLQPAGLGRGRRLRALDPPRHLHLRSRALLGRPLPDRPFYPQRAAWLAPPRSPGVDNGVFYRELSPYGRWVLLEGRYVWMPQVERGWRPYTEGRWEYTQRYGWTWVSNEPFGWATYHYGRWAYSNRLGWVWVPGTQWAPAWVAWRGSDDHLAWAPLPPDAGPGFALDEGFDEIPSYYWQVVPAASFLLPNLADAILRDDDDRRPSLDRSRPIGNVTVVNNVVVNNVINIEYVEEKTRERVVPREIVITNEAARQAEPSDDGGPHLPAAGDRGAGHRDPARRAAGGGRRRSRARPPARPATSRRPRIAFRRRPGRRRSSRPPRRRRSPRTKRRHRPRSSPPPRRRSADRRARTRAPGRRTASAAAGDRGAGAHG